MRIFFIVSQFCSIYVSRETIQVTIFLFVSRETIADLLFINTYAQAAKSACSITEQAYDFYVSYALLLICFGIFIVYS